jgi:protein TonB
MRDLGPLGHCLVEDEGATLRSAQRRRVSLLISVTLQAAVLGALLLIPLLMNGERLSATVLVWPIPPPNVRGPEGNPRKERPTPPRGTSDSKKGPLDGFQPKFIPPVAPPINDLGDANQDSSSNPPGTPQGPGVPGGTGDPDASAAPFWASAPPMPAPPSEHPRRIKVSVIDPGRIIHRVQPVYPPLAKQAGVQGEVKLRAVIGTNGTVREVVPVSGHLLLIAAAKDAVQQWRYQPTLLNGQPVEVETQITVVFVLGR